MTYVITAACIDVKDAACQKACPVECIYEGGRMMYIHPDECVDCGVCLSVCAVTAIYADDEVPADAQEFLAVNVEFFGPSVTDWGSPGGVDEHHVSVLDHPLVTQWPRSG